MCTSGLRPRATCAARTPTHCVVAAVLEGVDDQVLDGRAQRGWSPMTAGRSGGHRALDGCTLLAPTPRPIRSRPSIRSAGANRRSGPSAAPRFDARVLQHALDHLAEPPRLALHDLAVLLHAVGVADHALRQVLRGRADHGDRRAQLVRDAGHELHLLAASRCARRDAWRQQRHADRQQQQHAEADAQVAPAHAGDGRLERAARVLHGHQPATEVSAAGSADPPGPASVGGGGAGNRSASDDRAAPVHRGGRRTTPGPRGPKNDSVASAESARTGIAGIRLVDRPCSGWLRVARPPRGSCRLRSE